MRILLLIALATGSLIALILWLEHTPGRATSPLTDKQHTQIKEMLKP